MTSVTAEIRACSSLLDKGLCQVELATSLGQTEEVALLGGWDGGRVYVLLSL